MRGAHEAVAVRAADGRDLGVGEDPGRDRAVVGLAAATGHVRRSHPRLVLADVRELRDAGHVADRPHVLGSGRAEPFVHLHPARRRLDAELLEPEPLDVRPASRRDEQALGLERRAVREVELDPGSTRSIPTPRRTSMPSSRNSSAISSPASGWTRPSRCSPRSTTVTCDAHAREELRELGADRAAAHDDEAPRHLVRPRRVAVRPVLDRVEALDRRNQRPRAGGERRACRTAAPAPSTSTTPGRATRPSPRTSRHFHSSR